MTVKNMLGHTLDLLGVAIVSGRFEPGASLPPEAMLCSELGVSRTVVREAVKSLVAKGLLSTGPKVGTRVLDSDQWNWFDPQVVGWISKNGLSHDYLRDLQELRRVVEPAAARLAAERATEQDLAELEDAFAGMKKAIEYGGDYVTHDLRFHQGLLKASHNRMVIQMAKALGVLLRTSFEISTAKPNGPASSLAMHRAVLDAVIAHQPDKAERANLKLIDGASDDIESVLATRRKLPSVASPALPLRAPRGASRGARKGSVTV